jgi:hypothetical protein
MMGPAVQGVKEIMSHSDFFLNFTKECEMIRKENRAGELDFVKSE